MVYKTKYKMKKIVVVLLILFTNYMAQAQLTKDTVLINEIPLQTLIEHPSFQFQPPTQSATETPWAKQLQDYQISIYLGTWCTDSHYWVPQVIAFLQQQNFPMQQLRIYGLDETKTSTAKEEIAQNISFVPTFIFTHIHSGEEKGRIVENIKKSVAEDIYTIIHP